MWESRKLKLYGYKTCPGPQPNSSGWDLGQNGKWWNGRNGKSGKLSHSNDVIGALFVLMLIYKYVCAPPSVGAWSMAALLWQLFEYHYYYY